MGPEHLQTVAAARASDATRRIRAAIDAARETGGPYSIARIATAARVSRQTIYNRPELREEVERLQAGAESPQDPERASRASLEARLAATRADNQRLRAELAAAREEIARLLGRHLR